MKITKMNYRNEIWKEYPLHHNFENNFKIEFSNFGRVKSYNAHFPKGNIIKGSLQGGFPIVRITLFKAKTEKQILKILEIQKSIDALNQEIKNLGNSKTILQKKLNLREERDGLIKKRMKVNEKINHKRKIFVAILVHKAVVELFLDKPKNKDQKFIIHKDFDKTNNHVENLAWANQEELNERSKKHPKNILHEFRKQFEPKMPNVKASKLGENDVLYIKNRLKKGDTLRKLAQKFNVSDMQIHRIKTGENWSHIKLIEEILEK